MSTNCNRRGLQSGRNQMNLRIVITEVIVLQNKMEAISCSAVRYWRASMTGIETAEIASVSTASGVISGAMPRQNAMKKPIGMGRPAGVTARTIRSRRDQQSGGGQQEGNSPHQFRIAPAVSYRQHRIAGTTCTSCGSRQYPRRKARLKRRALFLLSPAHVRRQLGGVWHLSILGRPAQLFFGPWHFSPNFVAYLIRRHFGKRLRTIPGSSG